MNELKKGILWLSPDNRKAPYCDKCRDVPVFRSQVRRQESWARMPRVASLSKLDKEIGMRCFG